MNNKININRTDTESKDDTDSFLSGSVSSGTDCTGLMPSPPASGAELEAYKELYPFSPAQAVHKGKTDPQTAAP